MRGLDGELEMLVFVFLDYHFWMGFTVRHRTCNSVLYSLAPKVLHPGLYGPMIRRAIVHLV